MSKIFNKNCLNIVGFYLDIKNEKRLSNKKTRQVNMPKRRNENFYVKNLKYYEVN